MSHFRVISILAAYNEELYIQACLEHLAVQGVLAYLIDNESTDRTVELAQSFLGRNLIGIETMPRRGVHNLGDKLRRKQELGHTLDANWFIHQDVDEFRLPPRPNETLAEALARVEAEGANCVEFDEFVFIPTRQAPEQAHGNFQATMRHYYSFRPRPLHRLNAWKKQRVAVDLVSHGGHTVLFENQRIATEHFKMRHYHFLSVPHAVRKLVGRPYGEQELAMGMHGWRPQLRAEMITDLPSQQELSHYTGDDALVPRQPRKVHFLGELVTRSQPGMEPLSSPQGRPFRIIALLAVYNEELYLAACIEHLAAQGVEVYVIDDGSTDRSAEIARSYLGRGVCGIESVERHGLFDLTAQLKRKEELAQELDADWFIYQDADEFKVAPQSKETLAQAIARADAAGANAIQFDEFVFVPTQQAPDHAHPNFRTTMCYYYPLRPRPLHRMNTWKKSTQRVDLVTFAGHRVVFENVRVHPEPFKMRHYHFLSLAHAQTRYLAREYPPAEVAQGWHSWRPFLWADMLTHLPSQSELRHYTTDDALVMQDPRDRNFMAELLEHAASPAQPVETGRSDAPPASSVTGAADSPTALQDPATGIAGTRSPETPLVIITGMHRSGTSFVASFLERAGLVLGTHLNPPAPDNPRGFFEDVDIVQFHQDLLHARGQTIFVDSAFDATATLPEQARARALTARLRAAGVNGWKDPRASLFLALWDSVVDRARYVLLYRSPLAVLFSLMRRKNRDMAGLLEALEAWTSYNTRILDFYRAHSDRAVLCGIDAIIREPTTFVGLLSNKLQLDIKPEAGQFAEMFHANELHPGDLDQAALEALVQIHRETLETLAALEEQADLGTPDTLRRVTDVLAMASAPLARPVRRAQLLHLCASLEPETTEEFFAAAPATSLQESLQYASSLKQNLDATRERLQESLDYTHSLENSLVQSLYAEAVSKKYAASLTETLEETRAQRNEAETHARSLVQTLEQANSLRATAEEYAWSLEQALKQANSRRVTAEEYAQSLVVALEQTRAQRTEAEAYARSLGETLDQTRAARERAEEYARSLETTLEQSRGAEREAQTYIGSLQDTLELTRTYLKQSEEYARSLQEELARQQNLNTPQSA